LSPTSRGGRPYPESTESRTLRAITLTAHLQWELFCIAVDNHPDEAALIDQSGAALTFSDLRHAALTKSSTFSRCGVTIGTPVAIYESSEASTIASLLALWRLEAIPLMLPFDPSLFSRARVLDVAMPQGTFEFDGFTVARRHTDSNSMNYYLNGDMLFVTSGSTGIPKVVAHSSLSLIAGLKATIAVQQQSMKALDHSMGNISKLLVDARLGLRYLASAPVWTMSGFTLVQRALLTGETLILGAGLSIGDLLTSIGRYRTTNLSLSPFVARRMAREQRISQSAEVSSLLTIGLGGGPVSPELVEVVEETFRSTVLVGYGATELAGPAIMSRPEDSIASRSTSIGRALPEVVCTIDPGSLEPGSDDASERGVLSISAPSLMRGYLGQHGEQQLKVNAFDTGDVVERLADGTFRFIRRQSNTIMRGGLRIDPVTIERTLELHPVVDRARVRGMPSRVLGEEDIIAEVTLLHRDEVTAESIRDWSVSRLPSSMVPRLIRIAEVLPTAVDGEMGR